MILITGLGNPGKKYTNTRHNIGNTIVTKFAKNFHFEKFKLNKKLLTQTSKKADVLLALPTTYMNESGKSVKKLYKPSLYRLWVIHDDIDLPLGKIKISINRTSAGHKGVQSIINELGTQNFIRFRIGICPLQYPLQVRPANVEEFVLEKFNREEQKIVNNKVTPTAVEAIAYALDKGMEKAMTKYN